MLTVKEEYIDTITETFHLLLKGTKAEPIKLPENYPDNEIKQVISYINRFLILYNGASEVAANLSKGELNIDVPKGSLSPLQSLKTLRANLLHLTWTTQQIAQGNFGLQVDFMGDFSVAFNSMARQLEDSFQERQHINETLQKSIQELNEKNENLDRLNKLFIDREFRIKQLRDEVKKLKNK